MSHFDDLPQRDGAHELEEAAIVSFQTKLAESGVFIRQGADRKDYGTVRQIEVVGDGQATNVSAGLWETRRRCGRRDPSQVPSAGHAARR